MYKRKSTININPKPIIGNWSNGWAMDIHTIQSTIVECGSFGYDKYDTTRTELGEALYLLKYKHDRSRIVPIAEAVSNFILNQKKLKNIKVILPVPPSQKSRSLQPVKELALKIGSILGISVSDEYLKKVKDTPYSKKMNLFFDRKKILEEAFSVADQRYKKKHVLVFDDLIKSGETLKAITNTLLSQGNVSKVSVVVVTKTRSSR